MVNVSTQLLMTKGKNTLSDNNSNKLKKLFPMIRSRKEVLEEILNKPDLQEIFDSWDVEYQEAFLDMCTGVKGIKLLYDSYFKEIMNPDTVPERLEEVLSLLLGKK